MLTNLEKKVIASIQGDIAIAERPYRRIADKLGISEEALLDTLQDLCQRGVIRRFGATLKHQKSGYAANAMVAWKVDEERVPEVGKMLAAFRAVSHCYRRNPTDQWPYNLYTMVHGRDEAACRETAIRMSQKVGVMTYILLFSRRELKKTSMRYFPTE
jgi:DNA-binding Lrp family transcriptional regulator